MKHIFKCKICNRYTMKEICSCGSSSSTAKPMKYTLNDKLGYYRRKAKLEEYQNRGLL